MKRFACKALGWQFTAVLIASLTSAALGLDQIDSFAPDVNGTVHAMVVQPNGKILIGGEFYIVNGSIRTYLARVHSDGSLDNSFDTPAVGQAIHTLALQADGKILVGGLFSRLAGQPRANIARLNPDGTADPAFNPGADGPVYALAVQPDGMILVGGEFATLAGETQQALARLYPDGTLDLDFQYSLDPLTSEVDTIALQPDGKILLGGDDAYGRLNPDGTRDSSFFLDPTDFLYLSDVNSIALQSDGKILVGGHFTQLAGRSRTNLARLNPDGTADSAFNPGVTAPFASVGPVSVVAFRANGKILVGGFFDRIAGQPRTNLARLNTDGTLDNDFICDANGWVNCLARHPYGKMLVGGNFTMIGGQPRPYLARLTSDPPLAISHATRSGDLSLTDTYTNGVCTIERADALTGPWRATKNLFTTSALAQTSLTITGTTSFYRALARDLAGGRAGFTNLTLAYGKLTTIAGAGGRQNFNNWQPEFEGALATEVFLSGPHIAMADRAGEIYIADKDSHGIRKIRLDGTIITVAGFNSPDTGPDDPMPGTSCGLRDPNGLWVRPDGTVFILDTGNGKVRRLDTDGTIQTLFTVPGGIVVGRGLWVSDDETLAYFCSFSTVKRWTRAGGVTDFATSFSQLGNLVIDPSGSVVVTDRAAHRVYRLNAQGNRTVIAGNGTTFGGGDGQLATSTALDEVRGVWFLPTGAFFVATHRGSQVWYIDTAGYIHLFLNGHSNEAHAGDGTWFYNPLEARVSEVRAVTVDHAGNLLITENDIGFIRKVEFLPVP
jgi:uncharacterized delta-60 repeat protein